jgi:hypothetical protein
MRTGVDAVFRSGCLSDLFGKRRMGFAEHVHQSGVSERHVHRRLHARSDALFRQQHTGLQLERPMGLDDGVRSVGVRERVVHWRVRAGHDAVLGQRRAAL